MTYFIGDEEVRGTIIGGDPPAAYRYEFWTKVAPPQMIARAWFDNDAEAAAWFTSHDPDSFARGLEMRVWDRSATTKANIQE